MVAKFVSGKLPSEFVYEAECLIFDNRLLMG